MFETLLILGTIAVLVGIYKIADYAIERNHPGPIRWWRSHIKKLTPYQQERENVSIEFLQRVVNQRKAALSRLYDSGFIDWDEYNKLYNALIDWKDKQIEIIHLEAPLC